MLEHLIEGPLLWFLNRGTGVAVLVVLTLSTCLGALGAGRHAGARLPAFVPQAVHRNLSILGLGLTAAHVVTAVADGFVDIRWWQAFSPLGADYEPVWLGLGTLAWDLMLVVALSTALRHRIGRRTWHRVHLLGYAAWPVALAHAVGIGTDSGEAWARWLGVACTAAVVAAVAVRLRRREPEQVVAVPAPGRDRTAPLLVRGVQ